MHISYFTQPHIRLGDLLMKALEKPHPSRVVLVSAFVALQTLMRLKFPLLELRNSGTAVNIVVGLDLGGTSKEVLTELFTWNVNVTIVKNRIPGHTFHPKLYLIEWPSRSQILIGSNNITEGGFYRNYEAAVCTTYDLTTDGHLYATALKEIDSFIQPGGPIARQLTSDYLALLLQRRDIPTESEARQRTASNFKLIAQGTDDQAFGSELIAPPPPLSAELLERLVSRIRIQRAAGREHGGLTASTSEKALRTEQIAPAAFYMSLPTLQGASIPGEARIPLAAIQLAEEFWGWPEKYGLKQSPQGGRARIYHEWKPIWRIWNVERQDAIEQPVRMYRYDNSSDFRFYARPLVTAGGDLGDIVRIVRVSEPAVEFECELARIGTSEHHAWRSYCTTRVRNSPRSFGYG